MSERLSDVDLEKVIKSIGKKNSELIKRASQLSIGGRHKSGPSQEEYEICLRGSSYLSGVLLGMEIAMGRVDEIKFGQRVNLKVNDIVQE